jgi:phosphoserine phosphatase RsbU/P
VASPYEITLHTLTGPYGGAFSIPSDRPVTVGRSAACDLCLLHEGVSRRHATILRRAEEWFILDQGSVRGTFLNGVRLEPTVPSAVSTGDLLRIGPWTFRVNVGSEPTTGTGVATLDDSRMTNQRVERIGTSDPFFGADRRLRLLVECLGRFDAAAGGRALADAALESALHGSGYARGAILRRINDGHDVEVVATSRIDPMDTEEFAFSGSLVQQASTGVVAMLSSDAPYQAGHSIAELRIHSALCAPVFLGDTVEGYLYLDARGQESSVRADSAGFCEAVARAYGLAVANVKRVELERRQTTIHEQLFAAREAQQFILPPPAGDLGFLGYAVEMRPGLFVAGDLFDVVPLGPDRVAICMGDVAGHGVASALLMAMTQSQLNAQIRATGDPAVAAAAVNRYVVERTGGGRFVSLWVGVFDASGELRYVDAGHGHWFHAAPGAAPVKLAATRGIPLGINAEFHYSSATIALEPGARIYLYSDGIIEQRNPAGEEFGPDRLSQVVGSGRTPTEDVQQAFAAMVSFAGAVALVDDATIASIHFAGAAR